MKGKGLAVCLAMAAIALIVDAIVALLFSVCSVFVLVNANPMLFALKVLFTALPLLLFDGTLIASPVVAEGAGGHTAYRWAALAGGYLLLQVLASLLMVAVSAALFALVSLVLLLLFLVPAAVVAHVSGVAKTWGKRTDGGATPQQ